MIVQNVFNSRSIAAADIKLCNVIAGIEFHIFIYMQISIRNFNKNVSYTNEDWSDIKSLPEKDIEMMEIAYKFIIA